MNADTVDAERYRWLRAQHWFDSSLCVVENPKQAVKLGHPCPSGDQLDALVDAGRGVAPAALILPQDWVPCTIEFNGNGDVEEVAYGPPRMMQRLTKWLGEHFARKIAEATVAPNVESLMTQAQVFASAWSVVGGPFDSGNGMADAEEAKGELRTMLLVALAAGQPAEPSPATLQARIQELEEQLQPYLDADAAAEALSARRSRVEEIADALFPQFSGAAARSDPSIRPPQWHDKSWWWNGVGVKWDRSHLEPRNGTVCINLSSYVGGGDVQDVNVHMPVQWLEADDWKPLVSDFIAKKVTERAAAKAAAEADEAQRQITSAKATLARLAAPKGDSNG